MKLQSLLQSLAIFAVSAGAAWWAMASLGGNVFPLAKGPVRLGPANLPVMQPVLLPKTGSSPGEMLAFIEALGQANAAECRKAFFETHEVALQKAVILRWAAVDPEGCWESLQLVLKQDKASWAALFHYKPLFFQQWIRVDPHKAIAALDSPAGQDLYRYSAGAMVSVAASIGGEIWQAILQDPRMNRMDLPSGGLPQVRRPPGSSLHSIASAEAAKQSGFFELAHHAGNFDTAMSAEEAVTALKQWENLPPAVKFRTVSSMAAALSDSSLEEGRKFVESLPPGDRLNAAQHVIHAWPKDDAAGSWQWLNANMPREAREAAKMWGSRTDPVAGALVLQEAPPSSTRDAAAAAMAFKWLSRDAAAMASWVQALDDPEMQRAVYNNISIDWAARDPEAAIAALTAPGVPSLSSSNYVSVASQLYDISPEKARAFVEALPPGRAVLAAKGLRGK